MFISLYDLIKKEDNLIRQREILDNKILCELYTGEEHPDKDKRQTAQKEVARLKDNKRIVEGELEEVRLALKNRLFNLLQQ